jgi:hypothetical protein
MSERQAARAFSLALDGWLSGGAMPDGDETEAQMSSVARRLARLPELLPAQDIRLHDRVLAAARRADLQPGRARLRWTALGPALAAILLLVGIGLFYPPGKAALAAFAARFGLGPFAVQVTPQPGGEGDTYVTALRRELSTLDDAQALVGFGLFAPASLPEGYALESVVAVSYEDMPVWIPQPFYVELQYGPPDEAELHHLTLREFGLVLNEGDYLRRIREVNFGSGDVRQAEEVQVSGKPAVLLSTSGDASTPLLRRLIWQEGDAMLELLSHTMGAEQMLDVAEHVERLE